MLYRRRAHLLSFLMLFTLTASGKMYPYPYASNSSIPCDSALNPPAIQSYHVHVMFNGSDHHQSLEALALRQSFIDYYVSHIAPMSEDNNDVTDMATCTFSHPDGYHPNMTTMCKFPFDANMSSFPFSTSLIFGASNYAFYIPAIDSLYFMTQAWFRQNYGRLAYLFHSDTGCENNDHTQWAVQSYNSYLSFEINKPALYCCHYGPPPMCYCNITTYQVVLANTSKWDGMCLSTDFSTNSLVLLPCGSGDQRHVSATKAEIDVASDATKTKMRYGQLSDGFDATYWRETLYTWSFPQLENFGDTGYNTYKCIGIDVKEMGANAGVCSKGNNVGVIDCYQEDLETNLFEFDYELNAIRAANCTEQNLCLGVVGNITHNTVDWVLDDCNNAVQFVRSIYL